MDWKQLLGSLTVSVDEELRLRNAYLEAENRIVRQQIKGRVLLQDSDRKALAELGWQLGKKALQEIATIAKPDTILAWHRTLADQQVDTAEPHTSVGRPRIGKEIETLVVRMARENRSWGYDRIVGALANLGYTVSDQTVGNILKRHSIPPAPERQKTMTWGEFIRIHMVILGVTNFFSSAVWSWYRLISAFLLLFMPRGRRKTPVTSVLAWLQAYWTLLILRRLPHWYTVIVSGAGSVRAQDLSRLLLSGAGVLRRSSVVCLSHEHRSARLHGIDKVVCLHPVKASQIRDGPRRCRSQSNGLLQDNMPRAA
jgi:hypothetical protein